MTTEQKQKRPRGRPPGHVPGSRREGPRVNIRLSIAEYKAIAEAALAAGESFTEFAIRNAMAAAASTAFSESMKRGTMAPAGAVAEDERAEEIIFCGTPKNP